MIFCEFCEIFKNTFFVEHHWWLLMKAVDENCHQTLRLDNFKNLTNNQVSFCFCYFLSGAALRRTTILFMWTLHIDLCILIYEYTTLGAVPIIFNLLPPLPLETRCSNLRSLWLCISLWSLISQNKYTLQTHYVIPRWNDVETVVSTSSKRGIHLVCL